MMRLYEVATGIPLLMIHGAIENGKIFYSEKGAGLAPFLARRGFDVYVADLRGRGSSTPHVSRGSKHGQTESITREIPLFSDTIESMRPGVKQVWVCHSWGGVLTNSLFARVPRYRDRVACCVYLGTRRRVTALNLTRVVMIDVIWAGLCSLLARIHGYLPARQYGLGPDDESVTSHMGIVKWVYTKI